MQDPTDAALAIMVDIPTRTLASLDQFIRTAFAAFELVLTGRPDKRTPGVGGVIGLSERAAEKVDAAVHAGPEQSVDYVMKRAARRGDNTEVLDILQRLEGEFDADGFREACREYGIKFSFVTNPKSGNPAVVVAASERSLAASALQSNFKEAVKKTKGQRRADELEEQGKAIARDAELSEVKRLDDVRRLYAELEVARRDPAQSVDPAEYASQHGLPDRESLVRTVRGQRDEPYEFRLERDPNGRTCWCCRMDGGVTLAADPTGGFMAYYNDKPAVGHNFEQYTNDSGESWPCVVRRIDSNQAGAAGTHQMGLLGACQASVDMYEVALSHQLSAGTSLETAFARTCKAPKGSDVTEDAARGVLEDMMRARGGQGRHEGREPRHMAPSKGKGRTQ